MADFMSLIQIKPIQCPMFLSDFNQIWIYATDFYESRQYEISQKFRSSGDRSAKCARTDAPKLIGCFRDCVNEPKSTLRNSK